MKTTYRHHPQQTLTGHKHGEHAIGNVLVNAHATIIGSRPAGKKGKR
ncbi:MAG: hypothetical protein ABSD81_02065 [Methanomicrobiales archaeon]